MLKEAAEEERVLGHLFQKQHTIRREVRCEGMGLHSGASIALKLKPAPPNYGIRFRRTDLPDRPVVSARYNEVADTSLATTIGSNGASISTVEHLMATLAGLGIDNALVEVNGPEVPIFDGSAASYFRLLQKAGLKRQNAFRQYYKVEEPLTITDGDAYLKAEPSDQFQVSYIIDFPHPLIGKQEFTWHYNKATFGRDIAKARTFGFLKDVQKLQSLGLAQGGSLSNAVVFDELEVLNHEGFRYPDECVRHKVLDFIGDLALAGRPVIGAFEVYKAGHRLHNLFLEALMMRKGCCTLVAPQRVTAFIPPPPMPSFLDGFSLSAKPA
jgi:UDP-3-O-[3-hydroxymyristoyl] N-acetylglucosamine deacetylase